MAVLRQPLPGCYGENCPFDPSLRKRDPKNNLISWPHPKARVVVLGAKADNTVDRYPGDILGQDDLRTYIHRSGSPEEGPRRRIYLMEGLDPGFISILGTHFNMDLSFFATHGRTMLWDSD